MIAWLKWIPVWAWLAMLALCAGVTAGGVLGVWRMHAHYQPLLDEVGRELARCQTAQAAFEAQLGEQNARVQALHAQTEIRAREAAAAQRAARQTSADDYQHANRLLRERRKGDDCRSAAAIVDEELGL
jgi:hypothetical protein